MSHSVWRIDVDWRRLFLIVTIGSLDQECIVGFRRQELGECQGEQQKDDDRRCVHDRILSGVYSNGIGLLWR